MRVDEQPSGSLGDGRRVEVVHLGAGPIGVGVLTFGGISASIRSRRLS